MSKVCQALKADCRGMVFVSLGEVVDQKALTGHEAGHPSSEDQMTGTLPFLCEGQDHHYVLHGMVNQADDSGVHPHSV